MVHYPSYITVINHSVTQQMMVIQPWVQICLFGREICIMYSEGQNCSNRIALFKDLDISFEEKGFRT